jgi:Xaa-Pro dipeptidase
MREGNVLKTTFDHLDCQLSKITYNGPNDTLGDVSPARRCGLVFGAAMDQEILARARQTLAELEILGALLSNPATVTWLTGYAPPILYGPSPFDGGPALVWLDPERVVLMVSDAEQGAATATGAEVRVYVGYQTESRLRPAEALAECLADLLGEVNTKAGSRVGIESLPGHLWEKVTSAWKDVRPIDGWTDLLRAVKTAGEIEKIQASCALCSTAHATLQNLNLDGQTELDVFSVFAAAMERQAGERIPILTDVVSGMRTAQIGGPPTSYTLRPGDPLLVDIVPRLNGYWGDSCNVYFAGRPSAELQKMYRASHEALDAAIGAIKPGVAANHIDRVSRDVLSRDGYPPYPHHTGHGIGTTYHEEPRICGYNSMPLQEGMVIALEPGIYVEGVGGVRLEHVVVVTSDGCKQLTQHEFKLP